MKLKDVKILWAHSGNRCAICKAELTPVGDSITIGEIAHIIAETEDGPRGKSNLTLEERNSYTNLILLCSNHHTLIDKKTDDWNTEKLHAIKDEHEKWVSNQLELGRISILSINGQEFIEKQKIRWEKFIGEKVWLASSITPLSIEDEVIDPLDPKILSSIHQIKLPGSVSEYDCLNRSHTRPNENGIINENLNILDNGCGHIFESFRNGHIEFLLCLDGAVKLATEEVLKVNKYIKQRDVTIIPYDDLFKCFSIQIESLLNHWNTALPYFDAVLSHVLFNTSSTRLYTGRDLHSNLAIGPTVRISKLELTKVINRETDRKKLLEYVLKRFVHNFGLIIDNLYYKDGKMELPRYLNS